MFTNLSHAVSATTNSSIKVDKAWSDRSPVWSARFALVAKTSNLKNGAQEACPTKISQLLSQLAAISSYQSVVECIFYSQHVVFVAEEVP